MNKIEIRPAAVILDEQQRVLVLRYRYSDTDVYNLPGGRLEDGETLSLTLVREMEEELGIHIEVGHLLWVGEVILPAKGKTTLHCLFAAQLLAGTPIPNPKHTTALAAAWLPIDQLGQVALYPNVGHLIVQHYLRLNLPPTLGTYIGQIEQVWY